MTPAAIIALISGFFKFFDQVKWLIQTLQKTPAEKHAELLAKMQKEADAYAQPGSRPQW